MRSLALYVINVARFTSNKSPWRNWLARPTVNREVGSSSLPGDSPWRNWLARPTVNREVGSSSLPGDQTIVHVMFDGTLHQTVYIGHKYKECS
ncbi:uncharacterized protein N7487_002886 [Penicillium crustosum]|uniref:uncharacterized protein n=1 Tax=Penicillium crustosum TaxID=36656 RepID=UPI002388DE91|nr:uncharacterized protein N7487_002886 [Penicillium crustosum]KAJ5419336.1 hypothetical protein N7487_002886 [Penicillium crustosum]